MLRRYLAHRGADMGFHTTVHRSSFLFLVVVVVPILLVPSLCAQEYYADILIEVDSSGFVTIEGITNYPGLLINNTEVYTSKKQSYWLFNLTKEDVFSHFVYVLRLPKGSSVNYISSSSLLRIEDDEGSLVVKGFGEHEPFSLLIQYQVQKLADASSTPQLDAVHGILLTAIIISSVALVFLLVKGRKETGSAEEQQQHEPAISFNGLTERQKQIMTLLMDVNIPLTQTDIQKELHLPKAAVSRNIQRLEYKGLIEKERVGMSNLIRLKKS